MPLKRFRPIVTAASLAAFGFLSACSGGTNPSANTSESMSTSGNGDSMSGDPATMSSNGMAAGNEAMSMDSSTEDTMQSSDGMNNSH